MFKLALPCFSYTIRRIKPVLQRPACTRAVITGNACARCGLVDASVPVRTPFVRYYSKSKDKKKDKAKGKVEINDAQLAETINTEALNKGMEKALETLKSDFTKHLSLRSTTGSIEMIPVTLDDKDYKLQELAQIVRKNPKTVVVNMSIFPQAIPAVLKAIAKSGMNLNPQQDGTTLYIPGDAEHRESLAKNAKGLFTKCKDAIRDVQNKHTKSLKQKQGISIDDVRSIEQQVVSIGDRYVLEATKIMESKQQELLGTKE